MKKVMLVMGSASDAEAVRPAAELLIKLDIPYSAHVCSAHRTPDYAAKLAATAREEGFGVIIAAAGKAAHLAGAFAARTTLPVIGIPIAASMEGMDALLSTVQMPPGCPVAAVAVNGSYNAALLAAQILAAGDDKLSQKLSDMKREQEQKVLGADATLEF